MKCYKTLFNNEGIKNNIGCYIMLAILFSNIIFLIIFILKGFNVLYIKINLIIKNKSMNSNKKNSIIKGNIVVDNKKKVQNINNNINKNLNKYHHKKKLKKKKRRMKI